MKNALMQEAPDRIMGRMASILLPTWEAALIFLHQVCRLSNLLLRFA